jgi:NACalpha-BTF3-like transcription factor
LFSFYKIKVPPPSTQHKKEMPNQGLFSMFFKSSSAQNKDSTQLNQKLSKSVYQFEGANDDEKEEDKDQIVNDESDASKLDKRAIKILMKHNDVDEQTASFAFYRNNRDFKEATLELTLG